MPPRRGNSGGRPLPTYHLICLPPHPPPAHLRIQSPVNRSVSSLSHHSPEKFSLGQSGSPLLSSLSLCPHLAAPCCLNTTLVLACLLPARYLPSPCPCPSQQHAFSLSLTLPAHCPLALWDTLPALPLALWDTALPLPLVQTLDSSYLHTAGSLPCLPAFPHPLPACPVLPLACLPLPTCLPACLPLPCLLPYLFAHAGFLHPTCLCLVPSGPYLPITIQKTIQPFIHSHSQLLLILHLILLLFSPSLTSYLTTPPPSPFPMPPPEGNRQDPGTGTWPPLLQW